MKLIEVAIEGKTPLILNKFTDSQQMASTNGTRLSTIGERGSPREQAEQKLYIGSNGNPVIPQPNLFRCIIDGGVFFKAGKSKITTQKSSLIPACVEINCIEIPIISREGWCVDTRPVRIPSTGGRILCHRPIFNDWKLEFTIGVDEEMMSVKLLRDILDASGRRIGLGDFRPSCKGPFGRFLVTHWTELKEKLFKEAA